MAHNDPAMTSLGEAYSERRWMDRDPRGVAIGAGSFVVGIVAVVFAILLVTTPLSELVGLGGTYPSRWAGGILAGLGVPTMFLGVVAVLPSNRREAVLVVVGAAVCVAGVYLFANAYPANWPPADPSMAFETTMTYFAGCAVALWSVISSVATYRVRNNPHGTVRMELTRQGETRTVHVPREEYQRYEQALRGDGGENEQVIREIQSKFED